jgi:hypothetical protein
MAIQLHRPRHIRVGFVAPELDARSEPSIRSSAIDIAVRGLLVGLAIALLLQSTDPSAVTLTVIGVLALGATLVSWSQ